MSFSKKLMTDLIFATFSVTRAIFYGFKNKYIRLLPNL